MTFSTLGLAPASLRAVSAQGYREPTPVQARAIPVVLSGSDLLAGAQTGTGKTAAFVLPMLDGLRERRASGHRRIRALVVVPTRELALQVEESVRLYGGSEPVRSVAIYGGVRMDRQVRALRQWPEIIVATPGRLLDHMRQGTVELGAIEIVVLDEADRMLDMGFINDVRSIIERLPSERQTLLFSATVTTRVRRLAEGLLRDPVSIDVPPPAGTPSPIRQLVHPVEKGRKGHLLAHIVRQRAMGQVLVFTRTKRTADRLAVRLGKDGIRATAIHGNKSQSQRIRALAAFKKGEAQVLVATDVAARGLDIDSLPHVVNFELPALPEDYVHRIGRTGRAGQTGTAISLVSEDERDLMAPIEKLLRQGIEVEVVPGFEPEVAWGALPRTTSGSWPRHEHGPRAGQAQSGPRRRNRSFDRPVRVGNAPRSGREGAGRRAQDGGGRGAGVAWPVGGPGRQLPGERMSGHGMNGRPSGDRRAPRR